MSNTTECAGEGCDATIYRGAILTRVSEYGQPFVGLCQDCINKTVILRETDQSVDLLERE